MSAEENSDSQNTNRQMQLVQSPANAQEQQVSNISSGNPVRTPRNMQGLLKFLLESTKTDDSTQESQFQPMDEERKQYLMNVFESMSVNIVEKLAEALKVIAEVGNITEQDDPSDCENALEAIIDLVDEVDIANDFQKIGGLQACKPCLHSPHAGIRWRAAELIGNCSQNNPNCQNNAVHLTLLNELLNLVDRDTEERVRVKSFYAISSIIRGNEPSLVFFHDIEACHTLMRALQSNSDRLKIKVAFLLSTAFVTDDFLKTQLQKMGFITLLIQLIMEAAQEKKLPSLEIYLSALFSLSQDVPDALNDCRQPNLNFSDTLDEIIRTFKDDAACIEAVVYATKIKNIVYSDTDIIDADR